MKFHRTLFVLFAVVLPALIRAEEPKAPVKNLLMNASFEAVAEEPDQAAGWFRWGQWINREDSWTPTHDGKALIGYHHWQIESTDDSGLWQDVTVTAGHVYEFSIYVNRDDPGNMHAAESVELRIETVLPDHQITLNSTTVKVADLATGDKWSKLSVKATASESTVRVLVRVVPAKDQPRGGAVKFDDASLHEQPAP